MAMEGIADRLRRDATCSSHTEAADEIDRLTDALRAIDAAHAQAAAEVERLQAEIVLLEATGAEAADEIERLRAEVHTLSTSCGHCGELESAWQEIERLRAERGELLADREALRPLSLRCDRLTAERDKLRVALGEMVTTFHDAGCHICGGDCASANPPVGGCPIGVIQRACAALKESEQ